ncbi:MAG: hypothetical protein WAT71_00060 [Ignavibacteria bacterium]
MKIILFLFAIALYSCGDKTDKPTSDNSMNQVETAEDTTMTPDEIFSTSLIQDIIGVEEDIDLQVYLEEEIYPMLSTAGKVSIDKISSSLYLLSYQESGAGKNFILKKYFDPQNNEIKFEKTETQLTPEDMFLK